MKKAYLIIICLLLCSCHKSNEPIIHISNDILKANQTIFEYGQLYKITDIFTNDDLKFVTDYLNISSLGENKTYIEYVYEDKYYKELFTFKVEDTTKPLIYLSNSYSITVGDTDDLASKIICADNYDNNPNCYITGDYDANIPGKYPLTYTAEDVNGNIETIDFVLNVKVANTSKNSSPSYTYLDNVIGKYKNDNTMIGIDVSTYQGDINWQLVKNAGVEFAMIRLGLGYDDVLKLVTCDGNQRWVVSAYKCV